MRIKIHRADHHSISLEVLSVMPGADRDSHVNVYANARYGSKQLGPVEINWSAFGSRPVAIAEAYANMIQFAVKLGTRLTENLEALYANADVTNDDVIFIIVSKTVEGILAEVVL